MHCRIDRFNQPSLGSKTNAFLKLSTAEFMSLSAILAWLSQKKYNESALQ